MSHHGYNELLNEIIVDDNISRATIEKAELLRVRIKQLLDADKECDYAFVAKVSAKTRDEFMNSGILLRKSYIWRAAAMVALEGW